MGYLQRDLKSRRGRPPYISPLLDYVTGDILRSQAGQALRFKRKNEISSVEPHFLALL